MAGSTLDIAKTKEREALHLLVTRGTNHRQGALVVGAGRVQVLHLQSQRGLRGEHPAFIPGAVYALEEPLGFVQSAGFVAVLIVPAVPSSVLVTDVLEVPVTVIGDYAPELDETVLFQVSIVDGLASMTTVLSKVAPSSVRS